MVDSREYREYWDKFHAFVQANKSGDTAEAFAQFCDQLVSPHERVELSERNYTDLYGNLLALWRLYTGSSKEQTQIKVFNPELEHHAWQSKHTVVHIVCRDRPFLVDSVRMLVNSKNLTLHHIIHQRMPIYSASAATNKPSKPDHVSVILLELDKEASLDNLSVLKSEIESRVNDVAYVVDDWKPMRSTLQTIIDGIQSATKKDQYPLLDDELAFLSWLTQDNFTFMGYRYYSFCREDKKDVIVQHESSSLGLMKMSQGNSTVRNLETLSEGAHNWLHGDENLLITKCNKHSTVHRPVPLDYIGIKDRDDSGKVIGEHRFIGLYTHTAYNTTPRAIPLIREKIKQIFKHANVAEGTHDGRALDNILETLPRDELFQLTSADLGSTSLDILHMQERPIVRLFIHAERFARYFSCTVYVPRDRYHTRLRLKMQKILEKELCASTPASFNTRFSDSILARTHFLVEVDGASNASVDVKALEKRLADCARSWGDRASNALIEHYGESEGRRLLAKYRDAFQTGYREETTPQQSIVDIAHLEELSDSTPMSLMLYRGLDAAEFEAGFKVFIKDQPISLSLVVPLLENFGLVVKGERPYKVSCDGLVAWIHDFHVQHVDQLEFTPERVKKKFHQAFLATWNAEAESDGFNFLILAANLSWQEVSLIRAYARYLKQIKFAFSQPYIEKCLSAYPDVSRMLIALFHSRHDPDNRSKSKEKKLSEEINQYLEQQVESLDDDIILRRYVDLVNATLRTNYYQERCNPALPLAFKLSPSDIPDMPQPILAYEIYVYSTRVEGVHLRGGAVSRGGLRWSDRMEDFRTEILGLVKAQQVKNSVIVPVGAKGGFVCREKPATSDRKALLEEGIACYRQFIRSLLSVTDNYEGEKVVKPARVVCHDGNDPYLVVAADKGTATFSDYSNDIAVAQNFWLKDAFASGGSAGYDHKKMGITARGAWESVKSHFRRIGVDCQHQDFTVVGIGDMAGDVFGNGMLLSRHIRLKAAFNHLHIFIDPDPIAETSYLERERLFNLAGSSWEDYDASLISKGGGIFKRSAKSITISAEVKKWLGISKRTLTPNDLIRAILKAPVDLLWNGGIGTYIKSSEETDSDVGDRANDALRINASDSGCKIIGEGGNLGVTQLGRAEFCANGGLVNTDFIDNAGGVDCSDNEVNIKILLNKIIENGDLTLKQRNILLEQMTETVANKVLDDNYEQVRSINITYYRGEQLFRELLRFLNGLEKQGEIDRQLEQIPADDELMERHSAGEGFYRSELSVLIAYAKNQLKEQLENEVYSEDPYYISIIEQAFPGILVEKYHNEISEHPLRQQLIGTKLANRMVNDMGINFAYRMTEETGATPGEVARCYLIATEVFAKDCLWEKIRSLDNQISSDVQNEMYYQTRRLLRRAALWILRHTDKSLTIENVIARYRPCLVELQDTVLGELPDEVRGYIETNVNYYAKQGVPTEIASPVAAFPVLYSGLDIADIALCCNEKVETVALVYFSLSERLELHLFRQLIIKQVVGNHWQALARSAFRDELDWQLRALTQTVLGQSAAQNSPEEKIDHWLSLHANAVERWFHLLADIRTADNYEFAMFSVVLRELLLLVQSSQNVGEAS